MQRSMENESNSLALTLSDGKLADAMDRTRSKMDEAQLQELLVKIRNWGKWGPDDQLGALNYVTPEKRSQAARSVRDGRVVSLALALSTAASPDNSRPVTHVMMHTGQRPVSADFFSISTHGSAVTHLDALCHYYHDGLMYNGYPSALVTPGGARKDSIDAIRDGIFTCGVLLDIPRLKGKLWLEPREPLYPEDLEAAEKFHQVRVERGDALLIRIGRHARTRARGPADLQHQGEAGLHACCLEWLHERQIAILGSDGVNDVIPNGYSIDPIHAGALASMGVHLIDNCDLEPISDICASTQRYAFLLTAAPLVLKGGTGSPVNPIAVF